MTDRKDRRTVDGPLRAALATGAGEYILEHGVERLAPEVLAEQFGIELRVIERLCTDRQGLLAMAARQAASDLRSRVRKAMASANDGPEARLQRAATAYVAYARSRAPLYRLAFSTPLGGNEHETAIREEVRRLVDLLHAEITELAGADLETVDKKASSFLCALHGYAELQMSARLPEGATLGPEELLDTLRLSTP